MGWAAPVDRSRRPPLDLVWLLASAAVVWCATGWAALGLLVCLLAWVATRPPLRELWLGGAFLAAAAVAASVLALSSWWWPPLETLDPAGREAWSLRAERAYMELWSELEETAEAAAREVADSVSEGGPEAAYRDLQRVVEREDPATTILLVNGDGDAVAWVGRGLVHEPEAHRIPRAGPLWWTSYAGASVAIVAPIEGRPRPWRVVVGRSFASSQLPIRVRGAREQRQWSLIEAGSENPPAAVVIRGEEGLPSLAIRMRGSPGLAETGPARVPQLLTGLALLALAVMRGIGVLLLHRTRIVGSNRPSRVAVLLVVGLVTLAAGLGAAAVPIALLAVGLLCGVLGLLWQTERLAAGWSAALGAGLAISLVAVAWRLQALVGRFDLAQRPWNDADGIALRVGLFGLALGGLAIASGQGPRRIGDRVGVLSAVAMGLAASLHAYLALGVGLLVVGAVLARRWAGTERWRRHPAPLVVLVVLAALLGATAWECAYRYDLRHQIEARFLPAMAPPLADEFEATWQELDEHFSTLDLADVLPGSSEEAQDDDLAYVLWRQSPLARADALSALAIFPPDGHPVRFSYGLPISADGELEPGSDLWPAVDVPAWGDTLLSGDSPLFHRGEFRGAMSFWLQPLPGFRLGPEPVSELASGLLRGGPAGRGPAGVLGSGLEYALYDAEGVPVVSPWPEAPPLEPQYRREVRAQLETPVGPAWSFVRPEVDGYEVIYLPILPPVEALERVGTQVLDTLLPVAALVLLGLLLGLPRAAFRDLLRRGVRSYSKRLLLVYAVLLIVPLSLLNWLLVGAFEENVLRDQRLAGEAAMASAQQILGDYIVSLDAGFVIDTALDDALLSWLSSVIHYEVNLYWGSSINASSKRELFTAGLLPERIPGEIYTRLAVRRENLATRTSQAGGVRYLELYAPLTVPGVDSTDRHLFISLPLLAQQEESRQAIEYLRRRAMLITLLLTLVAALLGSRLARGFTQPLHQLVEGTRRIAAGAPRLDLAPSELELAALVEAIDDMARRIAEGRERLEREKQVMETIVENVTSGLVSVDSEGRVVMGNRLARELLGVSVGDDLVGATRSRESLTPLTGFLETSGDELVEGAARLQVGAEEERDYRLVWVPIPESRAPAALFVLEDATEVLRAERLEAWAEMARIIAHEIKNPLTPIRLSTEHLQEVWRRSPERLEEVLDRCTQNILRQVEELQQIAMEFSTYSHIPRLERQRGDLAAAIRGLAEMYGSDSAGISVRFEGPEEPLMAEFDGRLLGRAVRNLVENALRASPPGGVVVVGLYRLDGRAEIRVVDEGSGVDPELLTRIFDPYFSTHDSGTGLGLPIARRVAEEHEGSIAARNRPEGGLVVTITIPLS